MLSGTATTIRLRQGFLEGLVLGVALGLISILQWWLGDGRQELRVGVTLAEQLTVCALGCSTGGAVAGLLKPWVTNRLKTLIVGILATVPAAVITGFFMNGPIWLWAGIDFLTATVTAISLGAIVGLVFGESWRTHDES